MEHALEYFPSNPWLMSSKVAVAVFAALEDPDVDPMRVAAFAYHTADTAVNHLNSPNVSVDRLQETAAVLADPGWVHADVIDDETRSRLIVAVAANVFAD